jgi:heptosyltransferase III
VNILFVTATRIGDVVLTTGVLDWLAKQYPTARFTIACGRPAAPLLQSFPQLDELIVLDKKPLSGHWFGLWARCVTRPWSLVVDLRSSALAWFLLAGRRVVRRRRENSRHGVAELGALFDIDPPPTPILWTTAEHERRAEALLPAGTVLGIGPTANWRGKEWPAERFATLIARLTASGGLLPGARVAVFGAPSEREAAAPVLASIPEARRVDLVGTLDLPAVAACLRRCALYVGNDSGLMHMAAAVGTPTLGLFGPGNETRYGPWGPRTAVVRTSLTPEQLMGPGFDHRTTGTLMESLTVEAVEAAARQLLDRTREHAA